MEILVRILVTALGIFVGASILPGVQTKNYVSSIFVAIVVGALSITIGLLLKILTLGLLAWGIFALLLDAILLQIADALIKGFVIRNFWWAVALAAIVACIETILTGMFL